MSLLSDSKVPARSDSKVISFKYDFNSSTPELVEFLQGVPKESPKNRQIVPKRSPLTLEIYQLLIKQNKSYNYNSVRLRIAICLLTGTGQCRKKYFLIKVN